MGRKAAAAKLTPEQRRERARHANQAKKCNQSLNKAVGTGEIYIGNITISCAVLEDGTALINQKSIYDTMDRTKPSGRKPKAILELEKQIGGQIPSFLAVSNLIPFLSNELREGGSPVFYLHPKLGKCKGYRAEIIPQICDAYLDARRANVLTKDQLPLAERAELIYRGLGRVGIQGLVYECTGYEKIKGNNELQSLFDMFIAKELQPWTKRFPSEFFEHIKRMYGLEHLKGNPQFAGKIINKYVYSEISPEVLEELKKLNPVTESGYRKHCHHQLLTDNVGHPALEKQVRKIITLMSVCDTKDEFDALHDKSKR
jgi:hypothetical protein